MKYLGLDVHESTTSWCLLDEQGEVTARGKVTTTAPDLCGLVARLDQGEGLLAGQEVGNMSHFVHDVLAETAARLLSFNAQHLRMIASSRKKSDRRDAFWIAKSLQTGMMPSAVFIPTGPIRELRALLVHRDTLMQERARWLLRGRKQLVAVGCRVKRRTSLRLLEDELRSPEGLPAYVVDIVKRCHRMAHRIQSELSELEAELHERALASDVVQRLQTIPSIGERIALRIHATIGDVRRFRTARELTAYAGLVPSVRQSGNSTILGRITCEGSKRLRANLVQAAHVLLWCCKTDAAKPLQAKVSHIAAVKKRRKVAIVAAARHILRIAFYVMRDGSVYQPKLLTSAA